MKLKHIDPMGAGRVAALGMRLVDRDEVVSSSPASYDPVREGQLRADVAAIVARFARDGYVTGSAGDPFGCGRFLRLWRREHGLCR